MILTEEQRLLQEQVRQLLAERSPPDRLRRLITEDAAWDAELWKALADLGVLGAGIPEEYGGVGLGPVEVGIVAEELGRAVAPVPFFSSICLAAEALMIAGTPAQKEHWLPKLASGEIVATFAWTEGKTAPSQKLMNATLEGDRLNGRKSPVADVEVATLCVVAALQGGGPALALVELNQPGVSRVSLSGIDQLRHHSAIEFNDAKAEPMDGCPGAEALQQLLERAAVFGAYEQVGGAEAAIMMARDFTLQRYIFGRPLASFQAVKHKLADIFAKWNLAKCNVMAAGDALRRGAVDIPAIAATARIGASQAYDLAARENLQLHGGIGFTWEANCHFHYRRARLLALNLGSVEFWTERLMTALTTNSPGAAKSEAEPLKRVVVEDSPDDAEYRATARKWLAQNGDLFRLDPQNLPSNAEATRRSKEWTKLKWAARYSGIAHPREFGGAGGTRRQAQIFAEEEARAGIPGQLGGAAMPMAMAAVGRHGTLEQRRKWETLTYSGEAHWCQLFSEPGAGSDLAGVRTRAVRDGDRWIVNGQKVWTSSGDLSDYGILLARTDPSVVKHAGLSFFVIDMRQPGVTTRPIRQINGHSGFTETFLENAVALNENRIGDVGQGWAVAMSVLAQERSTTVNRGKADQQRISPTSARGLIELAKLAVRDEGTAFDSAVVRAKIAQWHVEAQGVKNFTTRLQQEMAKGGPPPLDLPVLKLTTTNRLQQIYAFMMDLDEAGGFVQAPGEADGDDKFEDYITSASNRIAGGSDEVLRNQIAERALGMPGDMRADKDVPFDQLRQGA